MYNKKYRVEKIEEFGRPNHVYLDMEGRACYLVYLNPGERGWWMYIEDDWFGTPHRVHTSVIKDVEYTDDRVIVTTQNTRLTFRLERSERLE